MASNDTMKLNCPGIDGKLNDFSITSSKDGQVRVFPALESKRKSDRLYMLGKEAYARGLFKSSANILVEVLGACDERDMHPEGADQETMYRAASAERLLMLCGMGSEEALINCCYRALDMYQKSISFSKQPEYNSLACARMADLYLFIDGSDLMDKKAEDSRLSADGWRCLAKFTSKYEEVSKLLDSYV